MSPSTFVVSKKKKKKLVGRFAILLRLVSKFVEKSKSIGMEYKGQRGNIAPDMRGRGIRCGHLIVAISGDRR